MTRLFWREANLSLQNMPFWDIDYFSLLLLFKSIYTSSSLYLFIHIPNPLPSGNCQNVLYTDGSVSVLLVHLICFLDSIVDRYVFIAILLFIFFILFFFLLKKIL